MQQIIMLAAICLIIYGVVKAIRHESSKTNPDNANDKAEIGIVVISLLIPLVGFIIYGVNSTSHPVKAKAALNGAIFGVLIGVIWYLTVKR